MGRIKVLPDNVANKIAAGEVVERPAAVAKELLENSLDAGATRLRIDVENGGKRLIRIADDGLGMGRDDAMLAFERHATSKLREMRDLLSISTLGFRGEALPSIASVSRLLLETRSADETTGTRVEIAGGRMLDVSESALPAGTTISVRDLFYNVPARRKFLRTEKTELAHIASLVTHYSLAHLDKSFLLRNEQGELLHVTPVANLGERVYQVFGGPARDQLVEIERITRELEVAASPAPPTRAVARARSGANEPKRQTFSAAGFVSTPQVQKRNRNTIYIFVNNRLIRDRVILRAISSAYHNIIPPGTFPFALLFLDMPFDEVDVNVHPSKTEVRFRHQSFVYDFVRDTIRNCLMASKPVAAFPVPPSPGAPRGAAQPATSLPYSEPTLMLSSGDVPADEMWRAPSEARPAPRLDFSAGGENDGPADEPTTTSSDVPGGASGGTFSAKMLETLARSGPVADSLALDDRPHARAPLADPPGDSMEHMGQLRPLGQIKESFIIAAGGDALWIIDQHVAHERILFEKVLRQRQHGFVESQRLLMPIIVSLKADQEIKFTHIEQEFRANGFDIEPFGHGTIAVKAAPATLSPRQVEALIQETLDAPEKEFRDLSLADLQRRVAATIACHAAIKVNMRLDEAKIQWLLDELAKTDYPMSCPHGRPVALKYDLKEILKAFHRI